MNRFDARNGLTLVYPTADGAAVWHISPNAGHVAALTGAWLVELGADLRSLTVGRVLLDGHEATVEGLAEFAAALAASQIELDGYFDEHRATHPKKSFVRSAVDRWPARSRFRST